MVEYPLNNNLSIVSPFLRRAKAPFCHKIGATSEGVPRSLSCLHLSALWHNSSLSSKIFQNSSISPLDEQATSTKLMVTTP